MKPEFRGFFNLTMSWAEDGANFNSYNLPLYFAALEGDTSYTYVENCIKAIPAEPLNFYGKEKRNCNEWHPPNGVPAFGYLFWRNRQLYKNAGGI